MMAEARAVAYGDPYYLGSLTGNSNNRGFPQYVRRFTPRFWHSPHSPVPSCRTRSPIRRSLCGPSAPRTRGRMWRL